MKIHWKFPVHQYLNSLDLEERASIYRANKQEIDFMLAWWARTRDEQFHRKAVKIWRQHLDNEKKVITL